jgi:hypothetical protein
VDLGGKAEDLKSEGLYPKESVQMKMTIASTGQLMASCPVTIYPEI